MRQKIQTSLSAATYWLSGFVPGKVAVSRLERLRACCGALSGILVTALVSHALLGNAQALPFLIAPMGASAVLLFALPSSPLAQPWSILGGNMVSAAVGVACALWISDPNIAAALAVAGAIAAMFALRCLHPPGGAIALSAVLGGAAIHAQGFYYVLSPVGLNSLLLLLIAVVFNNLTRHRYPHKQQSDQKSIHKTGDITPTARLGFTSDDLDAVIKKYNQVLDISRDDLEFLFKQTEMQSYQRRFDRITCGDIMSRDIISVEFGTLLEDAWLLLRKHKIKALPVVDRARRVIGILTVVDFMKHANLDVHEGFEIKLRQFIKRTTELHSQKPEVVGQIMTTNVHTADEDKHIVELVPLLSDAGMHHIPIIDKERRLAGIVTQSDLVAALYRGRLVESQVG
ncbi:MAG: HPP family protein [Undibacterium sp.]|nr:HPP family protein [Undibacterium sp.]